MEISANPDGDMIWVGGTSTFSVVSCVGTPTLNNVSIGVGTLRSELSGGNVTVTNATTFTDCGAATPGIFVTAPFTWAVNTLTLTTTSGDVQVTTGGSLALTGTAGLIVNSAADFEVNGTGTLSNSGSGAINITAGDAVALGGLQRQLLGRALSRQIAARLQQ